jgi:hypothetical protein
VVGASFSGIGVMRVYEGVRGPTVPRRGINGTVWGGENPALAGFVRDSIAEKRRVGEGRECVLGFW